MNLSIWCKSFLSIYNLIPGVVKGIDNLIILKGVNSSATSCNFFNSTLKQTEGIINLSQKKINLINLKILTDETLLDMKKDNSKLLILKYIDNISVANIVNVLNIKRRTFYRKLNNALKEFEYIMNIKLLNNKVVYNSFLKESLLEDIFERINTFNEKSSNENCVNENAENICNFIVNKMKKAL